MIYEMIKLNAMFRSFKIGYCKFILIKKLWSNKNWLESIPPLVSLASSSSQSVVLVVFWNTSWTSHFIWNLHIYSTSFNHRFHFIYVVARTKHEYISWCTIEEFFNHNIISTHSIHDYYMWLHDYHKHNTIIKTFGWTLNLNMSIFVSIVWTLNLNKYSTNYTQLN